jgi:lysophospholipase L1-like esterase
VKSLDNLKLGVRLRHPFSKNVTEADNVELFQNAMRITFQQLLKANKRVIYIMDIPELGFNPSICLIRPWKINNDITKNPCTTKRDQVENDHETYRALISKVLNEFPQITIWNPADAFCDETYCWAVKDKKMLYRDDNHLNETGSIYLGEFLNKHYPIL